MKKFLTHASGAILEGSLVALLMIGLMAGTALAGRGGNGGKPGGGGTVSVVDIDGDGVVNYGDQITFAIQQTATDRPFVALNCYQGAAWVYSKSVGYFPDYPWDQWFVLTAGSWAGGAADCTAKLYTTKDGSRSTILATTAFAVAP